MPKTKKLDTREFVALVVSLLTRKERRELHGLFAAIVMIGLLETVGVASIGPFMAVVTTPDIIHSNPYIKSLHDFFSPSSHAAFVLIVGGLVMAMLTISNSLSALTLWRTSRFLYLQQHYLSERLLARYLAQPYPFFLERNTSDLTKNIFLTVNHVVAGIFMPGMQAISRMIVAICIMGLLLALDTTLALVIGLIVGGSYALLYTYARVWLSEAGHGAVAADKARHRAVTEALGGVREIKLLHAEDRFVSLFSQPSREFARRQTVSDVVANLPRNVLEVIAFGGILLIMLYLFKKTGDDMTRTLPFVALYAFSAYRLMPAVQLIFFGLSRIRFHSAALELLAAEHALPELPPHSPKAEPLPFRERIELRDVTFAYQPNKPILRGIDLEIRARTTIGLVGSSGAGKTTLVDLLLGLLPLGGGRILVDGKELTGDKVEAWRMNVGYVPQQIFLLDDSIARNIAFGVHPDEIDMAAVKRAARLAHIDDYITSLPHGYETVVGERGVRLSGGQRQRIGIARAMYRDPSVLVFDEATNSLDNVTEAAVVEAIRDLGHDRTIVMIAHRLATIEACDMVIMLDGGRVAASGRYEELLEHCPAFRRLAESGGGGS